MKKILSAVVVCAGLGLATSAHAVDSTGGCGLGSMAWRGQSGIIPQSLAITTNNTLANNTFGITSVVIRTDVLPAVQAEWYWLSWKTIWNSLPWMLLPVRAKP